MADLTRDSDRILGDGRALLRDNRDGGRHRRQPSIGEGSARLKKSNLKQLGPVEHEIIDAEVSEDE